MEIISTIAERRIREAIEEGLFEGLSNAGKPLRFEDETWIPEDLRIAYRVLKNAGFTPPEVELGKEIINLRALIETIDDDAERLRRLRELNHKLLCFNLKRGRPLELDAFPRYEDRIARRVAGI